MNQMNNLYYANIMLQILKIDNNVNRFECERFFCRLFNDLIFNEIDGVFFLL